MGGVHFAILASGSAGNAAFLSYKSTNLLIDNGLSVKELTKRLAVIGRRPEDITGFIVSHEHIDHVKGVSTLLNYTAKRGQMLPVHATTLTAAQLDWGRIEQPPVRHFSAGRRFSIGDIDIEPFTAPHDCCDPTNFVFSAGDIRIGFSTDLGFVPPAMKRLFADCQVIVLESNHDTEMLQAGAYPEDLKHRVGGSMGHLSNDQAAEYLLSLRDSHSAPGTIVLGHLSEESNLPRLAEWSARRALLMAGVESRLLLASQCDVLEVL